MAIKMWYPVWANLFWSPGPTKPNSLWQNCEFESLPSTNLSRCNQRDTHWQLLSRARTREMMTKFSITMSNEHRAPLLKTVPIQTHLPLGHPIVTWLTIENLCAQRSPFKQWPMTSAQKSNFSRTEKNHCCDRLDHSNSMSVLLMRSNWSLPNAIRSRLPSMSLLTKSSSGIDNGSHSMDTAIMQLNIRSNTCLSELSIGFSEK